MELLEILLILLALIVVSAVLDSVLPRVSLPLVQIGIGVLVGLTNAFPVNLTDIDAELFLVLFIAPLLFDESRNTDYGALKANLKGILSLAIGLVIATMLCIGFALDALQPSIPLAAALALGAALGPTDAVAVSALGGDINLSRRQKSQLSGEALLNDASGVVSFQFAITAAMTGTFSLAKACATFAIDFMGGLIIGVVISAVYLVVIRNLRKFGVESATIHLLLEIVLPFATFLACETVGVSGILGVVACGLFVAFFPQKVRPAAMRKTLHETRVHLASSSLWEVLSFTLNGIVFLFLGITLVQTIGPLLAGNNLSGFFWLVGLALLVSAVTMGVRYVWLLATDYIAARRDGRAVQPARMLRDSLVTTLAGPKGAVTLSIALTIPAAYATGDAFPERDLLIFIASSVIVITLLLANFAAPALAPAQDNDEDDEAAYEVQIRMLQQVIRALNDGADEKDRKVVRQVVRAYQRRIAGMRRKLVPASQLRAMRLEVLDAQRDRIRQMRDADDVDMRIAEDYLKRISRMRKRIKSPRVPASGVQNQPLASTTSVLKRMQHEIVDHPRVRRTVLEFKVEVERAAVQHLKAVAEGDDARRAEAASALLAEHLPLLQALKARLVEANAEQGIPGAGAATANATGTSETGAGAADGTATGGAGRGGTAAATTAPADAADAYERTRSGRLKKKREENAPRAATVADVQAEALRLELDQIQEMRDAGRISRSLAREMRADVYLQQMGLDD